MKIKIPWAKVILLIITIAIILAFHKVSQGQAIPLPYKFKNLTKYHNDSIYIALLGRIGNQGVWIDLSTMEVNNIDSIYNTIKGPEGSIGALGSEYFADCFTPLSEIPDQTIQLPLIASSRIFIGFGEQMYLYFFKDGAYAGADLANQSDPNQNIRFEMIELTYNTIGLWTNTTRVDHYQYPMGQEVWGADNFYKKVGEVLSHVQIIEKWQADAPIEFQPCLDAEKEIIHGPSKINEFKEGGVSYDFYNDFVDDFWAEYTDRTLLVSIGDEGTWTGQVFGEEFRFTNSSGTEALISAKPNTQEILEGKGVLATDEPSTSHIHADLNIQKHFCAAINRGAIDLSAPSDEVVSWGNEEEYFLDNGTPYNFYIKFWHQRNVSYEGQTYAFAYDDVFDYSSTTHTTKPDSVQITLGGFSTVIDNTLNTIRLSPENTEIFLNETQQFSVKGFNAKGEPYTITDAIEWTGTDENGLFTANELGVHNISATVKSITVSTNINVLDQKTHNNTTENNQLKIYPTIAKNNLHVEFNKLKNSVLIISSMNGSILKKVKAQNNRTNIDISTLKSGVYFITIYGKDNFSRSFVKQ